MLARRSAFGMKNFVIHDLRRTSSTMLHERGFASDVIEKALNHSIGGIRGVYNVRKNMPSSDRRDPHCSPGHAKECNVILASSWPCDTTVQVQVRIGVSGRIAGGGGACPHVVGPVSHARAQDRDT